MAKNKRDWSQINARKGKRYVEREQKPAKSAKAERPERTERRQEAPTKLFGQEASLRI